MQIFIWAVILIIYLVVIGWTWNNLEDLEKSKKAIILILGTVLIYLITNVIFLISRSGINYENAEIKNNIGNIIVILFTSLNSLVLPFVVKNIMKLKNGEIEEKEFKTKIIILVIIFVLVMIIEKGYMKNIQQGILDIYQSNIIQK